MNLHFKEVFAGKVVNKRLTFNTGMDEFPRYVLELPDRQLLRRGDLIRYVSDIREVPDLALVIGEPTTPLTDRPI